MPICKECLEEVEDVDLECDGICKLCHNQNLLEQMIYEEELAESWKCEDGES